MAVNMRYDISVSDFQDNNGLIEYISMMSTTLGVDPSKVMIKSLTEGSTVIDSGIAISTGSDSASVAAAQADMDAKKAALSAAQDSGNLGIVGIPVLGFSAVVAEPVITEPTTTTTSSKSKKNVGLIVGLTIGLVALAAGLAGAGWFFWKKAKANRVAPNAKNIGYVNANTQSPSQQLAVKNEDMERILSSTPVGLKSEGEGASPAQ